MRTEPVPTTVDVMMEALAHFQRRKLLLALLEHNPQNDSPVVVTDSDRDGEALDSLVMMNHVHLPKLAEYGFIEWDSEAHEVQKGERFEEIRPLLELLDDHRDELPSDWV